MSLGEWLPTEKSILIILASLIFLSSSGSVVSDALKGLPMIYGRYSTNIGSVAGTNTKVWTTLIPPRMYWFIMESPSLFVGMILLVTSGYDWNDPQLILPCIFVLHYFLRTCVYGFLLRGGNPGPLINMLFGAAFTMLNGYVQVAYHLRYTRVTWDIVFSPPYLAGLILFLIGMGINHHSDTILRHLRKDDKDLNHYIPHGGLFEYVSGANFFGETIEWLGYAIAAGTIPAICFFLNTFFVIGSRAYTHHQWYHGKFKDAYPKHRKAFIPFVF